MRLGIIGTGRIGSTLARILVAADHEVVLANSRGPRSIGPLLAELGPAASAAHPAEAADRSELLVLMVPFDGVRGLLPPGAVRDSVIVDATNAFSGPGAPRELDGRGSSELVAEWYPGARIVKSLNTMHFETLAVAGTEPGREGSQRLAHFVAGDDGKAKEIVAGVVTDLGFAPVDTGPLHSGGILQQPGGPLFNRSLTEAQALAWISH
ncbi:NAD(P)-binding domain-containing protein [Streptomyces goshikiensis]|uniref:NAD(P)-binding domain-containing protein n=6 Tax=Streptomyces TaxID=1883 RepID=A0ABZ1RSQ2_9ACTN|nr:MULTISPECIES: NAD(P)-binding domain-containing protein [Streptomyces]AKL65265.1 F420-dependent NADP oxidoreductase [Streptomyces sp. Mg1]MBP0933282.1 NAD(P)-binding domain-containing protein [Streptomyces sp. KCTC 0041BP]RPK38585.1 NADP oxidoreductase coenzyme F420-dependent [Streptomyces sp. ADI91-18]WBY19242.1 NAD(P)-binding domain-containing protein [Streptomyces goshikiensis]WSR98023.1 NAD(P)-binding domain-containing protein [Streptomyces goshikiensis]